jgi:hypothetical protein
MPRFFVREHFAAQSFLERTVSTWASASRTLQVSLWSETVLAGDSHGQVPSPKLIQAGNRKGSLVVHVHVRMSV